MRYTVEYKDIYVDEAGKEIRNPPQHTSEPTADTSDAVQTTERSAETLSETEFYQKYPEPLITEEEVALWQKELRALEAAEREEIRAIFEKGIGIPLERFMEMSDTEIETEFQKQFSISPSKLHFEKELEKRVGAPQATPPTLGNDMESRLQEKYSTFRFRRAMATLNHYGPEEGIRRLQEIDPEVAKDVEGFLQKQQPE